MTQQDIDDAFNSLQDYFEEIRTHNEQIFSELPKGWKIHFKKLMDYADVNGFIEKGIAPPPGCDKDEQEYGPFKDVQIDQWSVGDSGDSYQGFIYTMVGTVWYKIPFKI